MKKIILLHFVLLSFFYINIENIFALQIKNLHIGNSASDRWIEIFNDGDDITDFTSSNYKIIDNTSDSKRSIIEMSTNKTLLKNSTAFIYKTLSPSTKISETLPPEANLIFRSAFVLNETNGYISLVNSDNTSTYSCFAYGNISCPQSGSVDNSTSTNSTSTNSTSTNSTSTDSSGSSNTNIVYVYLPSNNQNKYGDISVLLPEEKIIPAGADVEFNVKAIDRDRKAIIGLDFQWSFGDGGEKFGQKVSHYYTYPGEYTLVASADGYTVGGEARMNVKVIVPDISISKVGSGGKENFIDLTNNTDYDLVLSNFYLDLDNNFYKLPKNFTILKRKTVHVSGEAVGFKLPATNISLNYPNKNLLISYLPILNNLTSTTSSTILESNNANNIKDKINLSAENVLRSEDKIINNTESENNNYKNSEVYTETKLDNIKTFEPFILKRLVLNNQKESNLQTELKPNKPINLNKTKNVDTGIVDWFKSLIY